MLVKILKDKKIIGNGETIVLKAGQEYDLPAHMYNTWEKEKIAIDVTKYDENEHVTVESTVEGIENAVENVQENVEELAKSVDVATAELKKEKDAAKKAKELAEKEKAEYEKLLAEEEANKGK